MLLNKCAGRLNPLNNAVVKVSGGSGKAQRTCSLVWATLLESERSLSCSSILGLPCSALFQVKSVNGNKIFTSKTYF